jgi:hypothetical protein
MYFQFLYKNRSIIVVIPTNLKSGVTMINNLFERLLKELESNSKISQIVTNGEEFEIFIQEKINEILEEEDFSNFEVTHNGKHGFPDLKITFNKIEFYGLEIKFSASGNWNSKGNSVFETHSNKDIDSGYNEIYVLFGRKPKPRENKSTYEFQIKPYGDCIDKIEVTHSPRFSINMNTGEKNLFTILDYPDGYSSFRTKENKEKNIFLRKYFNSLTSTNEADKWYLNQERSEEESSLSIQPIPFTSLSMQQKRRIIAEGFILFPYDLFKDRADYSKLTRYMISKHFVYSASLRDSFSSGGKTFILNEETRYPQMIKTFYDHQLEIKSLLKNPEEEFERECYYYWGVLGNTFVIDEKQSLEKNYEMIIEKLLPEMTVEKINPSGEIGEIKEPIELYKFFKE